jgi:hypothetical protein
MAQVVMWRFMIFSEGIGSNTPTCGKSTKKKTILQEKVGKVW